MRAEDDPADQVTRLLRVARYFDRLAAARPHEAKEARCCASEARRFADELRESERLTRIALRGMGSPDAGNVATAPASWGGAGVSA